MEAYHAAGSEGGTCIGLDELSGVLREVLVISYEIGS